jgi:hypothetical protein
VAQREPESKPAETYVSTRARERVVVTWSERPREVLRVQIDSAWSAVDFATFFAAVDSLSAVFTVPPGIGARGNPARVQWRAVESNSALRKRGQHLDVVAVRFGSSGIADFAGFGEIVGHVKDFVLRIIEMRRGKELAQEELRERRIENAKSFLDVYERARDLDLSPHQREALVANIDGAQGLFLDMVDKGQVTGVELVTGGEPPDTVTW